MYSFLFDPTYMTLILMALLIFLVLFLWRKLTILEGNFYILEKRVNLMKKDSRENKIAKSIERSNIVMNEIFGDACKSGGDLGGCVFPVASMDETQHVPNDTTAQDDENVKITFTNDLDLDKKIEEAMDPVDIINALDVRTSNEAKDVDNVSVASDITFNTDEKYSQKKLSKMNLDRLKDVCSQLNLNSDGTKAQLITRILENNK
jgi:hypothetical protein